MSFLPSVSVHDAYHRATVRVRYRKRKIMRWRGVLRCPYRPPMTRIKIAASVVIERIKKKKKKLCNALRGRIFEIRLLQI